MKNCFAINIAWPPKIKESVYYYRKCFQVCERHNIGIIRVFLVPWGLYPIERVDDLKKICEIIQLANEFNLEIVLVLDTYVNYVKSSYRDFADSDYSWYTNTFSGKTALVEFLCAKGKNEYLEKLSTVLQEIVKYDNVKTIELCNEIDQIEAARNKIVFWVNNNIRVLRDEYGDRYNFIVSISDYRLYKYYSRKIECKCDIHSYRFPYNTAMENYEYLREKFPAAWISEFGCFSDFAYTETIESKIYHSAMILRACFERCMPAPAAWWWETILNDSEYMNVYSYMEKLICTFEKIEVEEFWISDIELAHDEDLKLRKRIQYRLSALKKNPLYFKQELPAITKFLKKKMWKKYNHNHVLIGFESEECKKYYILETYAPVKLEFNSSDNRCDLLVCTDITRNQTPIPISMNEAQILREGTYLFCRWNSDVYLHNSFPN